MKSKESSLLLGAGFSIPAGYPSARQLNDKITNLQEDDFCIAQEGSFCFLQPGQEDPFKYSSNYTHKLFFVEFIRFYIKTYGNFKYEDFYDYFNFAIKKNDPRFLEFTDSFRRKFRIEIDNTNLIMNFKSIFTQVISAFLVDRTGDRFYEHVNLQSLFLPYENFIEYIKESIRQENINVHTLNHDLLFEQLNYISGLKGFISNGFQIENSPFYGKLDNGNRIQLPYFGDKYDTIIKLFKLHGSLDQYPFHIKNEEIDSYIKTKPGVRLTEHYKESINSKGDVTYHNDWINYHSDFLSGTASKIMRYKEPKYYEIVFNHFESNLTKSEKLIIIGYGCGDEEVNKIIRDNYNCNNPIFVIDPFPNDTVKAFCKEMKAKLLIKGIENLSVSDFK